MSRCIYSNLVHIFRAMCNQYIYICYNYLCIFLDIEIKGGTRTLFCTPLKNAPFEPYLNIYI